VQTKWITWAAFATLALATVGCQSDTSGSSATGSTSTAEGTVGTQQSSGAGSEKRAAAHLESRSGSKLTGHATFVERDGKVTLTVDVENGEPGPHGIHLHEKGDCSSPDAKSAGEHWNPTSQAHGKVGETEAAHSGDMGNLDVGTDGKGRLEFTTDRWSIGGDAGKDILGKAIVVHAKADDLKTQPSGDSGDRIGCGVIASE